MSINLGPEYIVNSNTSLVLVDTGFPTNSTAIVYLSSVSIPGRIISIKDSTGGLGPDKFITISTSKGVYFTNSTTSAKINAPYGFITCTNESSRNWAITNIYGFPTQSTPAYTLELNTQNIQVSSISSVSMLASTFTSKSLFTNNVTLSTLTLSPAPSASKIFGTATLTAGVVVITTSYANLSSLIFIQRTAQNSSTYVGHLIVSKSEGNFVIQSLKIDGSAATGDVSSVDWILFNQV
jgi:hypothetical protein